MQLEIRPLNVGPVFVGTYEIGGVIDNHWEPGVGDIVSLKTGPITVLTRISIADKREYEGAIIGFEQHDSDEYDGRKTGDVIGFLYANIFACSR